MIWTQLLLQHFFASSILKQAQLHQVVLQIICPTVSCEDATVTTNSNISLNCKYLQFLISHLSVIAVNWYYSCLILQLSQPCAPRAQRHPQVGNWATPHNCWQNISKPNTYPRKCTSFNPVPEGHTDTPLIEYEMQHVRCIIPCASCVRYISKLIQHWFGIMDGLLQILSS